MIPGILGIMSRFENKPLLKILVELRGVHIVIDKVLGWQLWLWTLKFRDHVLANRLTSTHAAYRGLFPAFERNQITKVNRQTLAVILPHSCLALRTAVVLDSSDLLGLLLKSHPEPRGQAAAWHKSRSARHGKNEGIALRVAILARQFCIQSSNYWQRA